MVKFKINPEIVRLVTMVTAFFQAVGAALALAAPGAVPATLVLVFVVIGGGLQAALASYSQGMQTNPPEGMLTEERAAELSQERELPGAEAPATYETGRAPVPFG
jgi:hypothetical protein